MPKSAEDMIASGPTGAGEQRAVDFQPLPANDIDTTTTETTSTDTSSRPHQQLTEVGDVTPANVEINEGTKVSDVLKQFDRLTTNATEQSVNKPAKSKTPAPQQQQQTIQPPTAVEAQDIPQEIPEIPAAEQTAEAQEVPLAVEIPAPVAKQMSKQAQEWVLAEMKRSNKAVADTKALLEANSKNTPASNAWYEHPDSYVLSEEFQQSTQNLGQYKSILRHYQEQLIRIREGDDWEDLSQNAEGQVVRMAAKQKASAKAEALIEERIAIARDLVKQEEAQQQQFTADHQQRSAQARNVLAELEKRYFPQYVQGIKSKNTEVQKYVSAAEQELKYLQQGYNPLTPFMLKLYASFLELKLNGSNQQQAAAAKVSPAQAAAGPTMSSINSSGGQRISDPDELPFNPKQWPGR